MPWQESPECLRSCAADSELVTSALSACADAGHWRAALALLAVVSPRASHALAPDPPLIARRFWKPLPPEAAARPVVPPVARSDEAVSDASAAVGQDAQALPSVPSAVTGGPLAGMQAEASTAVPGAAVDGEAAAAATTASDEALREMYRHGLRACGNHGRWEEALKLIAELEALQLPPCNDCFAHAIAACSNGAQWQRVLELHERMGERGMTPRIASHNAAIVALGKLGRCCLSAQHSPLTPHRRLPARFPHITSPNFNPTPNSTPTRYDRALALFEHLPWHPEVEGGARSTASYNATLIASIEAKQYERASELFRQSNRRGAQTRSNRRGNCRITAGVTV